MSKSILLVDTPENCKKCDFSVYDEIGLYCCRQGIHSNDLLGTGEIPNWCPLKPVPEKYAVENRWFSIDYSQGRNDVIDSILFDESEPNPHDPKKAGNALNYWFDKIRYERKIEQKIREMYSEIEKNRIDRTIKVHRIMHYRCSSCGTLFRFYLEKGLEDSNYTGDLHKPVPFNIGCICGGKAQHCLFNADVQFCDYVPLGKNENYFENKKDCECGYPHFRNTGIPSEIADSIQKVLSIQNGRNDMKRIDDLMREQQENEEPEEKFDEDDTYNLGHISTSTLKAELRRRKQQNRRKWDAR